MIRTTVEKKKNTVEPLFIGHLDCKTVGFFLKISEEIGKAWSKSLTRVILTGV